MTDKFVKPLVAVVAMSMGLAVPAAAQIAKFHMMAPAMPGLVKLDRTASPEGALADFVGSTAEMAAETSASLGQMRDAESIIEGGSQEIDAQEDEAGDELLGGLRGLIGEREPGDTAPPSRPDFTQIAAADSEDNEMPIISRPETGRQVIVRTRTKSPRGGSKIKTGSIWSVGEFR